MIKGTWFATMMFVVSIVGVGVMLGWIDPSGAWLNVAMVAVVVPPIWWWMAARQRKPGLGRGALAGVLCAALVFLMPLVAVMLAIMVHGAGQGDGIVGMVALTGMAVTAIPICATVGAITVLVQRRWLS